MVLRRRNVSLSAVKELDAFPKVAEPYKKQSAVGGTFSLISFIVIAYLICAETWYYLDSELKFKFVPDTEFDAKLKLNTDITVAMPCRQIRADVVDDTNKKVIDSDSLQEEETWWELSEIQRNHFDALKHMNSYFREEYHAIHELLWKSNQVTLYSDMPKRTHTPHYPPDACRIYGSTILNKVAGNLHITAGKLLAIPWGHAHISKSIPTKEHNFTHRIHKFSFGDPSPGIIHPLEGDEKITNEHMMLYQYFIEVVQTDINMLLHKSKTYQYSVKDHERPISHHKGSHGIPGIFFKYDTSALMVKVTQERDSILQFLVKLSATVAGIYVTSGVLNSIVQSFWYVLCCKFWKTEEVKKDESAFAATRPHVANMKTVNLLDVESPTIDLVAKPL